MSWRLAEQVSFDQDKTELVEKCRDKIGRLATWMNEHPAVEVALAVRADRALTGDREPRIGPARARVVRDALIAAGVAAARIRPTTFVIEQASCTQATTSCYELNRRVEVLFSQRD